MVQKQALTNGIGQKRRMLNIIRRYTNNTFGSRRGLLNMTRAQWIYLLGGYHYCKKIDWSRIDRLIFVCHGNICRSPLAEYAARSEGLSSESFGLSCSDGHPADPRAVGYAKSCNLDLSAHRTRNIRAYSPLPGDLVVVMEPSHLDQASAHLNGRAQLTLAGIWLAGARPYIHDPFCASDIFFMKCESQVIMAANAIKEKLAVEARA